MQDDNDVKTNFLNRRDWVSYLSALQNAASPKALEAAVKSGCNWLTQGATQASNWLVGVDPKLRDKFSAG